MRGHDRRRSPPPRGDDRRFGGGPPPPGWGDCRRQRSGSPPDRFRRSPPGKRFRRDEYDEYHPGGGGRFDRGDGPGRRERFDERYDDRPRQPDTFVEFVRRLPPHVGPEQANDEYRRYLAGWWGDTIKAEFEERKHDPHLRRRFDPREIGRVVQRRNELAAAAARAFAEQLEAGSLETEQQPAGPGPERFTEEPEGGPREEDAPPPAVPPPALCWQPTQLAADLALAKRLMRVLDQEKGIEGNPLLPAPPAAAPAAAEGGEDKAEGGAGAGDEQQPAEGAQQQAEGEGGAGPADMDAEVSPDECQAQVDKVVLYLWRVHGVDYYGGREYNKPAELGRSLAQRTQRGPKPSDDELTAAAAGEAEPAAEGGEGAPAEPAAAAAEQQEEQQAEGEGGDAAPAEGKEAAAADAPQAPADADGAPAPADGKPAPPAADSKPKGDDANAVQRAAQRAVRQADREAAAYERRVAGFWCFRIDKGDPLEAPMQRKRIDEEVDRWVDAQIIKHEENKWGSKLSTKLFMARSFVVKHIRNKHAHVVEAERERLQEEAYWENFRAFRKEEQRRQEEEQERVMAGMAAGGRGRGGMMEAAPMPLQAGMPIMPIIMPAAGGMGGMGGMGPVILPMEMVMGMAGGMGGGGRGGGRGNGPGMRSAAGGRGGRGGRGMQQGPKKEGGGYFDLDAPQNNRAVLDYGDL
ncbi:Serrate RNA effector molecule [Micractinium conductrix]|uniref:Serrate RNA effector molecule n=1 Tax=Micractinium conductrix TaxID=554055 RepID=A0A2P6VI03_9CHLO|nr:Serrate RNA effector molecule [Micractinium conductrix]|eukprot:PSC73712.1 Serrate RNA effector molecule [Micractinium conductrix]